MEVGLLVTNTKLEQEFLKFCTGKLASTIASQLLNAVTSLQLDFFNKLPETCKNFGLMAYAKDKPIARKSRL
jgi:hypothetical protein